jgi:cytochrome c oxidase assembly protein Cox11
MKNILLLFSVFIPCFCFRKIILQHGANLSGSVPNFYFISR